MSSFLRILLVGAGQIGSRHLQALASVDSVTEVVAVDPSDSSLYRARSLWLETKGSSYKTLSLVSSLDQLSGTFDLCILATNSSHRFELLNCVIRLGIKYILAEKVLFQSLHQLSKSLELCNSLSVKLFPNYVYRYVQPWGNFRQLLDKSAFNFDVCSGDIGLATNLPHWLDLVEYVSSSSLNQLSVTLSDSPYSSKRGGDLIDFAGHAQGSTTNGTKFHIFCQGDFRPPIFKLSTKNSTCTLDELDLTIAGDLLPDSLSFHQPMVSKITSQAVIDILNDRTVFPELSDTFSMNSIFLSALGSALYGDSFSSDTCIPVT